MAHYRLLVLCCVGCLSIHCATTRGAGQDRATTITQEIETAAQIVEKSNIADTEKRLIVAKLRGIVPQVEQLGKDVDHNKQIADDNKEAAKKWRVVKWLSILAVSIGGVFLLRRYISPI